MVLLWSPYKDSFAGFCVEQGGRGKSILQPYPGAVWESFRLGSRASSCSNYTADSTQGELGQSLSSSTDQTLFKFLRLEDSTEKVLEVERN